MLSCSICLELFAFCDPEEGEYCSFCLQKLEAENVIEIGMSDLESA
jgi:hypothetical protein